MSTPDLDGDGRPDTLWLANLGSNQLTRTLGVRTASGAGFSVTFQNAAPMAARATANTLADGTPVILLDTGRSVELYTVTGCRIVPTLNPQGQQYTFDKGFTGYGTGAGCPMLPGSGRTLVGYLAEEGTSGTIVTTVTRTTIVLSDGGRHATAGATVRLGTDLPNDGSAIVTQARGVSCGSTGFADEPGL